jgi:aminoglycoside phosphotransferase (APT) family kinase protein
MTQAPPPADFHLQRSSRDPDEIRSRLEDWLAGVLPAGSTPAVTLHAGVDSNGMSSETVILDVTWTLDGERHTGEYVARVAPAPADVPVFREYRLADQYEAMRLARELTGVPVPAVRWFEPTGEVLGTPFFLMDRVEGAVPPDVLPYPFGDNWLFDADPEQQDRLVRSTLAALAELHAIPDAPRAFAFLDPGVTGHEGATPLARNLAKVRAWYEWAAADLDRSPLVDRALAWLEAHVPATDEGVLCWGDARIGNVMYRDFTPVAVLDWEMASLGPRELDVSWIVFAHQVFQSIAEVMGMPGMPDFLSEESVRSAYAELSGVRLGDLSWYHVYNGVIWCIVFMRTGLRQVRFGEIERPDDIEALFHCKPLVVRLLDEVGA